MQRGKTRMRLLAFALVAVMTVLVLPALAAEIDSKFVGTYKGQFIGEDYGTFLLEVGTNGVISGSGMSTKREAPLVYSGVCGPDGTFQFTTGDKSIIFAGTIDWMNRMSGKWANADNTARGSFGGIIQRP